MEKRRERGRSKVITEILSKMPEGARGVGVRKFMTFRADEFTFGKAKNRFSTIPGRNI